jgi:uncharacterized Ntn-hydrolase superfamily protein
VTFSVLGRCERTGRFGIALSSSSPAVPSRCAFLAAGIGVAASQNVTDPRLGEALLGQLREGKSAAEALAAVLADAAHTQYRQLAVIDARGQSATFSGELSLGVYADRCAESCAAAGNLLDTEAVLDAAIASFRGGDPEDELEERLLLALEAAIDAGGEAGPVHSAGVTASGSDGVSWPITDLRVDFDAHGTPVEELRRLWSLWRPQRDDYVTRALDPPGAPAYGVPGDPRE